MKDQNNTATLDEILLQSDELLRNNSAPWVYLACHLTNTLVIQLAQKIFKIEQKTIDGKIFCFSKDKTLNVKEKSLVLFFAGVFMANRSPGSAFCLGQLNVLGERIKRSDRPFPSEEIHELKSEDWQNWNPMKGEIFVCEYAKYYLEHADIHIESQNLNAKEWAQKFLNATPSSKSKRVA